MKLSQSCPSLERERPASASAIGGGRRRKEIQAAVHASRQRGLVATAHQTALVKESLDARVACKARRPATAGVASATQKQNAKSEIAEARFVELADLAAADAKLNVADSRKMVATSRPLPTTNPTFEDELKVFEGTLEEMTRRIRLEGVLDELKGETEEDRRRAEEKRKREEAARKLRQQAKEAQNPKKRVQLQIERQRLSSDADLTSKVPMRRIEVPGDYGPEFVSMVDIRLLEARALGLNVGSMTFNSIYGLACDQEKRRAWELEAFGPDGYRADHIKLNRTPGGASVLSRTKKATHVRLSQQERRNDLRQQQAHKRRCRHQEQRSIHLLSSMRSITDVSEVACCSLSTANALREITTSFTASGASDKKSRLQATLSSSDIRRSLSGPDLSRRSLAEVFSRSARPFWWRVIRSVFCLVWLLQEVRRKHWAANGVRQFLTQVERVALLKARAHNLVNKVKRLQGECRGMLAKKRRWVEEKSKDWIKLEDSQLQAFARTHEIVLQPQNQAQRRNSMASGTKQASPEAFGHSSSNAFGHSSSNANNWKALRIPKENRLFALGRWYMKHLQKRVQVQKSWHQIIEMGETQREDIHRFFVLCGFPDADAESTPRLGSQTRPASEPSVAPTAEVPKANASPLPPPELLPISEEDITQLIIASAQELRDTYPFRKHPANRGSPQRRASSAGRASRRASADSAFPLVAATDRVKKHVLAEKEDPVDVDELFRKFTPRLREIREAPETIDVSLDLAVDAMPAA